MKEKSKFVQWMDSVPQRSCFLMLVAGAYILYTAYNLAKGVISGEAGKGFLVGVIVFAAAGIFMLFVGGRGTILAEKKKQKEAEAAAAEKAAEEKALADRAAAEGLSGTSQGPKSIAEKAKWSTLPGEEQEDGSGAEAEEE